MRRFISAVALIGLCLGCSRGGQEKMVACLDSLPFRATHVPPGFDPQPRPGVGGGGVAPKGQVSFYFRGPYDAQVKNYPAFIDVFRGEGGQGIDEASSNSVSVLGGNGRFGEIEDGYGATFDVDDQPRGCDRFTVNAYGVSAGEARRFVERLR